MKVLFAAFLVLQFGFVIFWQKNISTKAACHLSISPTFYVHYFVGNGFSQITVWFCNFLAKEYQ